MYIKNNILLYVFLTRIRSTRSRDRRRVNFGLISVYYAPPLYSIYLRDLFRNILMAVVCFWKGKRRIIAWRTTCVPIFGFLPVLLATVDLNGIVVFVLAMYLLQLFYSFITRARIYIMPPTPPNWTGLLPVWWWWWWSRLSDARAAFCSSDDGLLVNILVESERRNLLVNIYGHICISFYGIVLRFLLVNVLG